MLAAPEAADWAEHPAARAGKLVDILGRRRPAARRRSAETVGSPPCSAGVARPLFSNVSNKRTGLIGVILLPTDGMPLRNSSLCFC